jgi:creatinine amidohydrolase
MTRVMWKELTAREIGALAVQGAVVILPVASMEQHGPHLPVGVDTILCEGICRAGAEIACATRPVIVAPTLWCGMAEHHMSFGGTFTFDLPTYQAVLSAFLRSIERAGFRNVAIINGHGGNMSALNAFLPDFSRQFGLRIHATTYFKLASGEIAPHLDRQKAVMHACEVETSMMMAMAGDLVRTEHLAQAHGPVFEDARAVLAPEWQSFRSFETLSPSGVIGDARTASREKGEKLVATCARALAAKLTDTRLWSA